MWCDSLGERRREQLPDVSPVAEGILDRGSELEAAYRAAELEDL